MAINDQTTQQQRSQEGKLFYMSPIALRVACDVEPEKLQVLANLFHEFLPYASIPNLDDLKEILVVSDADKDAVVNDLLHRGTEQGTYVSGELANACAVPVETSISLECFIVLSKSFVQQINPSNPYAAEIVIPLLEEMLHVRHYSTLWQHQGYLHPHFDLVCTSHLYKICFGFYDEYIVNRWKFTLLTTQFTVTDSFAVSDFPLVASLDQAESKLFGVIQEAVANNISKEEAWLTILSYIYRDIFELLARYAALPQLQIGSRIDVSQSQFYQKYVASYSEQIQKELEGAYENDLRTTPKALTSIVTIVRDFLANIGVTYKKTDSGNCQIDFVLK